jgi:hypothetical protein
MWVAQWSFLAGSTFLKAKAIEAHNPCVRYQIHVQWPPYGLWTVPPPVSVIEVGYHRARRYPVIDHPNT